MLYLYISTWSNRCFALIGKWNITNQYTGVNRTHINPGWAEKFVDLKLRKHIRSISYNAHIKVAIAIPEWRT